MTEENLSFLPKSVCCADGRIFVRGRALTDYRECHDASSREARILFCCKHIGTVPHDGNHYVMKIKVQLPDQQSPAGKPDLESSDETVREVSALTAFRDGNSLVSPHLVALETLRQADDGPMSGGYISFTIMTMMPGTDLLVYKYWSIGVQERLLIREQFLVALKSVSDGKSNSVC